MKKTRKILIGIIVLLILLIIISITYLIIQNYDDQEVIATTQPPVEETKYCTDDVESSSVVEDVKEYSYDEKMGYIYLPTVDLEITLNVGNPEDLFEASMENGVAWDKNSGLPGEEMSMVVSGHRNLHFKELQYLEEGDPIILVVGNNTYTYEVSEIEIVLPEEVSKVYTNVDELVMYTCYPFIFGAPTDERYVVHATPVEEVDCNVGSDIE